MIYNTIWQLLVEYKNTLSFVNNIWVRGKHQRLQNILSILITTKIISFLKCIKKKRWIVKTYDLNLHFFILNLG